MKVLIACDKFRGSLNAQDVNASIRRGIELEYPKAVVDTVQLADGGEGSLDVLMDTYEAEELFISVNNAIGTEMKSRIAYAEKSKTAILEMAEYVGLSKLRNMERDPKKTSSYGLGQALAHAIDLGAKKVIIGIGGSATNDGGAGMLQALGFRFLNASDEQLSPTGELLNSIDRIIPPQIDKYKEVEIIVASDVKNPPTGANGATMVYAKQKGAKRSDLQKLEAGITHFARLVETETRKSVFNMEGYGAAGGIPIAACTFLNAKLISGSQLFFELLDLKNKIQHADLVITGEGKIDSQTTEGKAVTPTIYESLRSKKRLVLICGLFDSTDPTLSKIERYELADLAEKLEKDSFKDASFLCEQAGKQIGSSLKKER